jgi:hypothetical protein
MINIDTYLVLAREAAGSWTATSAADVARSIGGHQNAVIDWDEGAGECWVRLVVGKAVVAYVSTVLPLAIIERHLAETSKLDPKVQSIVVGAMADPELSSSEAAVETAFGHSRRLDMLNREQFSADDLWYATV